MFRGCVEKRDNNVGVQMPFFEYINQTEIKIHTNNPTYLETSVLSWIHFILWLLLAIWT